VYFLLAIAGTPSQISDLNAEIEQAREQLVLLVGQFGFMHPDVQQSSKHLDTLLLSYYEINKTNRYG
jgi:uncharacterized coiled-coil protein SlyX